MRIGRNGTKTEGDSLDIKEKVIVCVMTSGALGTFCLLILGGVYTFEAPKDPILFLLFMISTFIMFLVTWIGLPGWYFYHIVTNRSYQESESWLAHLQLFNDNNNSIDPSE